jgi:hypothetical protein
MNPISVRRKAKGNNMIDDSVGAPAHGRPT